MTPEEKNRLIAEKVMGWPIEVDYDGPHCEEINIHGDIMCTVKVRPYDWFRFDPYHRIEQAMEVLDCGKWERWDLWGHDDRNRKTYHCELIPYDEWESPSYREADTPSAAIVDAIVEVVGRSE